MRTGQGPIIFRVHNNSPLLASTRYRALLPALALEQGGMPCMVSDRPLDRAALRACRCIVFAKAFRPIDLELARKAQRENAPIVLDICDDMFVPEYGGGLGAQYEQTFRAMAEMAEAIVTTGDALKQIILPLAHDTPVSIVRDSLETPELVRALLSGRAGNAPSWRARASLAMRRPLSAVRGLGSKFAPSSPAPAAPRTGEARTLIWFGNHGAAHSGFGMGALAAILPELAKVAETHRIRLLVVSNAREKFDALFSAASFPIEYREWSPERIFADIDEADVCLMPMPREERFARSKSANRAALAFSRGAAVVATPYPALDDFASCIVADDWEGGLNLYLGDEARRLADVARGREIVAELYAQAAIARRWRDVIEGLPLA